MKTPFVWQMIKEAVDYIDKSEIEYSEIKDYINNKWTNVNDKTITTQIIVLTVNHESRIHYPENKKPRFTNSGSKYDLLFRKGRGKIEKYSIEKHGVWKIFKDSNAELKIGQVNIEYIFSPSDIIWFKNVTNAAIGEAYIKLSGNEFTLNFPNHHRGNILSPKKNELILLYQKVNGKAVFTHLVTPIDNKIFDENIDPNYRYGRRVKLIARTDIDQLIPVSKTLFSSVKLSGVSQGNACKIANISGIDNVDELQFDIWNSFKSYFTNENNIYSNLIDSISNEIDSVDPNLTVREGRLKLVSHYVAERNQKIVREKKRIALENNNLCCEVCNFSFFKVYDTHYIECHHLTPISESGIRETTLNDLGLVCANCHRMLHKKFGNKYLSIEELKDVIDINTKY